MSTTRKRRGSTARSTTATALAAVATATLTVAAPAIPPAQAAPCSGIYFSEVTTGSENGQFTYDARPTTRARVTPSADEREHVGRLWGEITGCVPPPPLTDAQRDSMLQQLACHHEFGFHSQFGGETWGLEAWRPPVAPGAEYDVGRHECNWTTPAGDGTGPSPD